MLAACMHGSTLNSKNSGIPERCCCPHPAACHFISVRLREQATEMNDPMGWVGIRSRFRALTPAVTHSRDENKNATAQVIWYLTMEALAGDLDPIEKAAWVQRVLRLVSPRIALHHFSRDATRKYSARKKEKPGAQFKIASKAAPFNEAVVAAELEAGTLVQVFGTWVLIPSFKERAKCSKCLSPSLSTRDPAMYQRLRRDFADYQDCRSRSRAIGHQGRVTNPLQIPIAACEQCTLLVENVKVRDMKEAGHVQAVGTLMAAQRPQKVARSMQKTMPINLLRLMIDGNHDVGNKGFKLLQDATSGARSSRTSTNGNYAECDQTAELLCLLVPPFRYDVELMDSSQTRQDVLKADPSFLEKRLVAIGPDKWHNREEAYGHREAKGVDFVVIKWTNKKDAAIMQFDCIKSAPEVQSESWTAVRKASKCSYVERGGGAFGLWASGVKLPAKLQEEVAVRGGLWFGHNGATLRHIYLHHEPKGKKGLLRIVPHQATNQRLTCITTTTAARRLVIDCVATRTIWLQRAWGLLKMSLIAELDIQLKVMTRLPGFLKCLSLVLNDEDFLARETVGLRMRLVDRALMHWWTLDSTESQRGISLWPAHDHISGHFDKQHRAEILFPEVMHPRALGQRYRRPVARTIIPFRNFSFALRASQDQMLCWLQSVHVSDAERGSETSMTVVSV